MADSWVVTGQRQTTEITQGGRFADVMEISFRTSGGTEGSVRIPLTRYSADAVRQAIEDYVDRIAAVENL